jgi:hypothetical protein
MICNRWWFGLAFWFTVMRVKRDPNSKFWDFVPRAGQGIEMIRKINLFCILAYILK